ncbi:MAG: TonB family protein [Marinobacter sp.]
MNPSRTGAKAVFLVMAVCATAITLVLAAPDKPLAPAPLGDSAVNSAPALKIRLAGRQAPEPIAQPEAPAEPEPESPPTPTPKPEPIAEPEPEPVPTPVEQPRPQSTAHIVAEAAEPTGDRADAQENQNAVPLQTAGAVAEVDHYLSKLSRHLARYYDYPRRARRLGQQGAPVIVFEFARDGSLIRHSLRNSSGHQLLNDAALQMLAQAAPLPEVPDTMRGQTFTYALPVRFKLR